jgi:GNAT superfamily N-acetyltransferase
MYSDATADRISHVFIIENDDVLGHCMIIHGGARIHEIWSVCISENARGKGLGILLFDFIIHKVVYQHQHVDVVNHGLQYQTIPHELRHKIWLSVDYANPFFKGAVGLYSTMGFVDSLTSSKTSPLGYVSEHPNLSMIYEYKQGMEHPKDASVIRKKIGTVNMEKKNRARRYAVRSQRFATNVRRSRLASYFNEEQPTQNLRTPSDDDI